MVVERFLAWVETAPDVKKVKATSALVRAFLHSPLDDAQLEAAEAAMTLLLDDPCAEVRAMLAKEICAHPDAPRHIIAALAHDKPDISTLVLARSPVFVDAELVEIIKNGSMQQQVAITCRSTISAPVAAAIAELAGPEASYGLLRNNSAQLPPEILHRIAERHGAREEIRKSLLERNDLMVETHLVLIDQLAELMREKLAEKPWMPAARIDALVRDNCDKAFINYALNVYEQDLPEIIDYLIIRRRLNASFLLRAICLGNIAMFSRSLATLAKVPAARVDAVLAENRNASFCALYKKAGLPMSAFGVFATAVEAWRTTLSGDKGIEFDKMPRLVTQSVLLSYKPAGDPRVDELLVVLRRIAAETARDNARAKAGQIVRDQRRREQLLSATPRPVEPEATSPEELFPVVDLPAEVLTDFAIHLADVIVDLEDPVNRNKEDAIVSKLDENTSTADSDLLPSFDTVEPNGPGLAANDFVRADRCVFHHTLPRTNPPQRRSAPSLLIGSARVPKRSEAA